MPGETFYFLGSIRKTYGIDGEVVVTLESDPSDTLLKKLESLFLEIEGKRIPFFISNFRKTRPREAILRLEMIDDLEQAKSIINHRIFTTLKDFEPQNSGEINLSILTGFILFDNKLGEIGQIDEVLMYPQNPLFKIIRQENEILVPVNEDLIEAIDTERRQIHMILPDGLIDLFS